jgi:antirestriction protein
MGNCVRCCYATRKREEHGNCVCARYPKWVDVQDMHEHFCGEFVSRLDYRAACVGKWN